MNIILYNRHNEVQVLNTRPGKVEAHDYNLVQTSLKKRGPQIRLRIPGLKHLELILQKEAWIVVDLALYEFPILCWTDFDAAHRESLHEPIKCEVRYFHYGASMIYNKTIKGMEDMLEEMLHQELNKAPHGSQKDILPFPKK